MIDDYKDDDMFCLTPWGCLSAVLEDYGIDTDGIMPKVGEHMVNDFMELMVKQGHVGKAEKDADN